MVVVSRCANGEADSRGLTSGPHTRAHCAFITGARAKRAEGSDIACGTSLDQVAAKTLGKDTPLSSLELAIEPNYIVGNCDNGYSCTYQNTFVWRTPTQPVPMENNPRVVFERLFGRPGTEAERRARMRRNLSILDLITRETGQLQRDLGPRDRARLGEYLDNIREIERRIERTEAHSTTEATSTPLPIGIPDVFEEHLALMYDLMRVAYQSDLTRVITFMTDRELSQRTYPQIGVAEQHHTVSHHGNDPENIAKNVKINTYHVELFSKFLEKLQATPDGDGSLLDHSLIFYGGGMGNPNQHASDPLPLVAVGGGLGRGQRHIKLAPRTPVGNLWVSVANRFDSRIERLGDSNGKVDLF
jgi:hypothetical protein